jgi:hypothetical protein
MRSWALSGKSSYWSCDLGGLVTVRIPEVEHPLMRNVRYLDKLVHELAKRRPMAKILRP